MDTAIRSAKANEADVVVAPFNDPIGRDAIVQWPGGVYMQLYWHTTAPNYAKLDRVPENRVYVSPGRADAFVRAFVGFSQGKIVSDDRNAPGIEVGRPKDTYRRVRIDSTFGKIAVLVTDGQLPYPYGREMSGYEVANLADTVSKAKAAGATVLVDPYTADGRQAAIISFPGGYIAENSLRREQIVSFPPHIVEKFPRMSCIPLLPGAVGCDNFETDGALPSRCVSVACSSPIDPSIRMPGSWLGCAVHRSHRGPSPLACSGPEQQQRDHSTDAALDHVQPLGGGLVGARRSTRAEGTS